MGRNKEKITCTNRVFLKRRLILVSALFILFGASLVGRLFFLQVTQHENLVLKSEKQYQRTINIHYGRGSIFDRNMNELTANIEVESVSAPAPQIRKATFISATDIPKPHIIIPMPATV